MWDWYDNYSGGDWGDVTDLATSQDAVLGQDMLNLSNSQGMNLNSLWNSNTFGGPSLLNNLSPGNLSALKSLLPGGNQGRGILDGIMNDPLGAAFNATPFLLAMAEANRQEDQISPILNRTNSLVDQVNPSAVRDAALAPYNRETASGLDRLTSSLQNRNVYGSSFGNADIANYKTTRDVGAGELGTKATLGSIGTQGALLDQVLRGTNVMNTNRNLILGAGLGASGRLFEPQRDPFGLRNLMGLT